MPRPFLPDAEDIPDGMPHDVLPNTPNGRYLLAQGDRGMARHLLVQAIDNRDVDRAAVLVDAASVYARIADGEEAGLPPKGTIRSWG